MAKRGKNQKKESKTSKGRSRGQYVDPQDMDDEIDIFHKQRDVIPLDVNDDVEGYDEDEEEPVFDDEAINDDDDEEESDDVQDTGFAAKIARQQKFLRAKFGNLDDEMHDDEEEDEEEKKIIWGGRKSQYYDGDNRDFELESSDDEDVKDEEAEVIRLQRERAKALSIEDFGLEDVGKDESDKELTLDEIALKGKSTVKALLGEEAVDDMEVDDGSGPELVDLLSELNDALEQLESRVNPLLSKVKVAGVMLEGGMRYLEVKQLILLAYCQAITFYLLLKSEGQPVRDHPVIARLVEIKDLLDKMKKLDGNLPSELEEFLEKNLGPETVEIAVMENLAPASDSVTIDHEAFLFSADRQEPAEPCDKNELVKVVSLTECDGKEGKQKRTNDEVGVRNVEMLKVRAALEEKLKQKGVFSSFASKLDKTQKHPKPVNRHLETYDDFDDDALDVEKGNRRLSNGHTSSLASSKLSQLVAAKQSKPKVISGDDDLPKRDDIGERRRKHELRVLAGAGIKSEDYAGDELDTPEADGTSDTDDHGDTGESEDEFYKQVKQKRAEKLAAKAESYTRISAAPSLPETVDGKRQISYQMEKNRGLTRPRKKLTKNPRKKYRTKHDKAKKRWGGQVRKVRKPEGPYGGESSGINTRSSRSIKF